MVLINHELYIYSNGNSKKENELICMMPEVFVKIAKEIKVNKEIIDGGMNVLYPIFMYMSYNSSKDADTDEGDARGLLKFYFTSQTTQKAWIRLFEKATGHFLVEDYYEFEMVKQRPKRGLQQ